MAESPSPSEHASQHEEKRVREIFRQVTLYQSEVKRLSVEIEELRAKLAALPPPASGSAGNGD